jgi:hypothetical protein
MSSTALTSASTRSCLHSRRRRHLVDKQVFKPLSLVEEVALSDHNSVSHSHVHTSRLVLLACHSQGSLCFGDWSQKEMVCMSDIIGAILGKGKGERALEEGLSDDKD